MSRSRNFCDYYSSIAPHNRKLKAKCKRLLAAIQDEQNRRTEKRKEVFRLNLQQFLKDVISKLNEKLELLKTMSFNLGKNFVDCQEQLKSLEDESILHQSKVDFLNNKLDSVEKSTNIQIHNTRQEFLKSYKNLMNTKFQFESMQKELDEQCKEQMRLENELSLKKNQLKETICTIKKLRDANEPSTVEVSEFDNLRNAYENLSLELAYLNSSINCMHDKMHRVQSESELIRQVFQSKMRIIKEYDEWSREGLMKQKNVLENRINNQGPQTSDDLRIEKLKQQIVLVQQQIEKSEECMDQLVKAFDEIQVWKRPCWSGASRYKHPPLHQKVPVIAVDYMGSTFVHLAYSE